VRGRRVCPLCLLLLLCGCGGERGEEKSDPSADQVARQLATLKIEPGLWERSAQVTDVRAEAVPQELLQRLKERRGTGRHCITPQQAARPEAQFLAGREGARCQSRSFAMEAGRMSGEMLCTDPRSGAQWTGRLDGRYGLSDYDLTIAMEMPSPFDPGQMVITSQVRGRRVGDCPAN
jgi:hypothetical protein